MTDRPSTPRRSDPGTFRDLTPLFASIAVLIFAVELYANVTSNQRDWVLWTHVIVVGALELFLIGYLCVWVRATLAGRPSGGRR